MILEFMHVPSQKIKKMTLIWLNDMASPSLENYQK